MEASHSTFSAGINDILFSFLFTRECHGLSLEQMAGQPLEIAELVTKSNTIAS